MVRTLNYEDFKVIHKGKICFFLFHIVQTGSTTYPASCSTRSETLFLEVKQPGHEAVAIFEKKSSYTFTSPYPFISTLVTVFMLASSCAFPLVPVDLYTA
jgi:hypothetical protein